MSDLPSTNLQQITQLAKMGDYKQLEQLALTLLDQNSDSILLWLILGSSLQEQGKKPLLALKKNIDPLA
jgi:hypothetical protein